MKFPWIVFILGGLIASGQGTAEEISGTVVDSEGAAIPGRIAVFGRTDQMTQCDRLGNFQLRLEPGSYRLRFEDRGFKPKELRLVLAAGEKRSLGQIAMQVGTIACDGEWFADVGARMTIDSDRVARLSGYISTTRTVTVTLRERGRSAVVASTQASDTKFTFNNLSPGVYDVEVLSGSRKWPGLKNVSVKKGEEVWIEMGWGTGFCITAP